MILFDFSIKYPQPEESSNLFSPSLVILMIFGRISIIPETISLPLNELLTPLSGWKDKNGQSFHMKNYGHFLGLIRLSFKIDLLSNNSLHLPNLCKFKATPVSFSSAQPISISPILFSSLVFLLFIESCFLYCSDSTFPSSSESTLFGPL